MTNDKKSNTLERMLLEIDNRPKLSVFFDRLEENSLFKTFFMLHPHDLFITSDELPLPFLIWSSVISEHNEDESPVLSIARDLASARYQKATRQFPFLQGRFPEELKDLLLYGAFILARTNNDIKDLITKEEFSLTEMRQGLRDFEKISNELGRIINESDDPTIQYLKKSLEATGKQIAKKLMSKPTEFLESIVNIIPNIYLDIHNDAGSHVSSLLRKANLNLEQYNQVLTNLYALGIIVRQDSVFRCEKCTDEPQILTSVSRIAPNKMNINCLICRQPMQSSAILHLDSVLKDCFLWSEGLVTVAIARLLKKKNIVYESFVNDSKFEYDFVCKIPKDKLLVECKVRRYTSQKRSIKSSIEQDLQQTSKHLKALDASSAVVIYNYDLEKYKDLVDKGTEKYGVSLISFNDASDYFESFS